MDCLLLSDAAWERMVALIIGHPDQKGSTGRNRMFVEVCFGSCVPAFPGVIFQRHLGNGTACPGASVDGAPRAFGWRIFEAISDDPDFKYLIVDTTIARVHQHAAVAKKGAWPLARRPEHEDPYGVRGLGVLSGSRSPQARRAMNRKPH